VRSSAPAAWTTRCQLHRGSAGVAGPVPRTSATSTKVRPTLSLLVRECPAQQGAVHAIAERAAQGQGDVGPAAAGQSGEALG